MRHFKKLVVQHLKRGGMVKLAHRLRPVHRGISHMLSKMSLGHGVAHRLDLGVGEGRKHGSRKTIKPLKFKY
jgi:hypothetical protein